MKWDQMFTLTSAQNIRTKKSRVKCWRNWLLGQATELGAKVAVALFHQQKWAQHYQCKEPESTTNFYAVCSIPGVSNTRLAGRICPAKCVFVAREHLKKCQKVKLLSNLAYFEGFSGVLWPAKAFFLVNCGPQSILSLECGTPTNLNLRLLHYAVNQ
jgi:hypothetical protein